MADKETVWHTKESKSYSSNPLFPAKRMDKPHT